MRKTILFPFYFLLLTFLGCATVPPREALNTYSLNGVSYISLISLCNARGLDWDYDSYSRIVTLTKGGHKISLRVGDTVVAVDDVPEHLNNPVDMYQGVIVVPYQFKEKILDSLRYPSTAPGSAVFPIKIKKVVIDAGHGGQDPGAIGKTGLQEKDVNLDIAKRLAGLLREKGITVVLTRSNDTFVALSRRVSIANNANADLFISIHSNANRVRSLKGFEVYYLTSGVSDVRRALNAAKYSSPGQYRECMAENSLTLRTILWDMLYSSSRAESVALARAICRKIGGNLDLEVLGIKGANFYVLRGAAMPAVLVEIGFVSNRNEERLLKNGFYRQQLAEAIAEGTIDYSRAYAMTEASR
ncbi:MAG: N-acetylmuramoyl-L-alanine amidase [Candidatus Omnitrophica bacterium]|nr:N-acetylmuramoyl-L-alanine amidase [Candidatus Omnitrophota bacterium]